ncbi:hypothetical protein [Methylobacterium nigriterrae]|uniref:hypothetical protein n=1 Tax=Methylobacterium nigriterrae TaxID=3127512 RepID=UPI003013321D
MDVVATPVAEDETAWWLTDLLGRALGAIRKSPWSDEFVIVPESGSRLRGVPALHASLDDALTAIEKHLGGTCELNPI